MKKVLVVDDLAEYREAHGRVLESAGFSVEFAYDGLSGLQKIQTESFDLIVSDVNMPYMDGMEMIKQVRENKDTKHLPVIIASTFSSDRMKDLATSLKVNKYFVKPVPEDELRDVAQQLVK